MEKSVEKVDILESLLQVAYLLRGEDGRCELSDATTYLYKRGLILQLADADISLRELIENEETFKGNFIIEGEIDTESDKYVHYLRLTETGEKLASDHIQARYTNPKTLFTWGFIKSFPDCIEKLAELALPERWDDGDEPFGILSSYITNTFKRLLHEKNEGNTKAIIETDKWAAFNTGLVDKLYDPIYALFSLNKRENMQKWSFHSWCTPGNRRAGQILSRFFQTLPSKAYYFQRPSDLLYDANAGVPTLPFEHIIERMERLPLDFVRKYIPDGFDWGEFPEGSPEFYESYREKLAQDDYCQLQIKDALELSLRRAVKKVAWNYRMVIPVYDAKRRKIMLLIPMGLDSKDNDHIDIALMVERAKVSLKYVGHTILTLGMAYRKARMIMSPEADWLMASKVLDNKEANKGNDEENMLLAQEISESEANADVAVQSSSRAACEEKVKDLSSSSSDSFLYQHENDQIFKPEAELSGPKVVGNIDISSFSTKNRLSKSKGQTDDDSGNGTSGLEDAPIIDGGFTTSYEEEEYFPEFSMDGPDYDIIGIYYHNYGKPYIISGGYRFEAREFTDDDLIDEDDVIFDVETEDNKWRPGVYRFAVNIRLAD